MIIEPGEECAIEYGEGKTVAVVAMSAKQERQFAKEFDGLFNFESTEEHQDKVTALFSKYIKWDGDPEESFTRAGMIGILKEMLMGRLVKPDEKKS